MRAEIKGSDVCLNLSDLIDSLSQDQRLEVIQTIACHSEIIDEVMNQVIDGYTSAGWYGSKGLGGNVHANTGIDGARMRIANASSEIAAAEIKAMAVRIESERQLAQKGWDAYHELLRIR